MNVIADATAKQTMHDIRRHEGLRLTAYLCTANVWTIGFGWTGLVNGKRIDTNTTINRGQAESLLLESLAVATVDALQLVPGLRLMNLARQSVIVNMSFNLGLTRLRGFRKALYHVNISHDFASAAREMLDSKWARQVGSRSVELADRMRSGQILTTHLLKR